MATRKQQEKMVYCCSLVAVNVMSSGGHTELIYISHGSWWEWKNWVHICLGNVECWLNLVVGFSRESHGRRLL